MKNMAMRSQVYEWDATNYGADTVATITNESRQTSIFVGGVGNNITKPAETTATEFVVIEDIATTATDFLNAGFAGSYRGLYGSAGATATFGIVGPRSFVQVRINTTDYFLDPDNVPSDGIPGSASPYPREINYQPSFNLYPDVYVLPGQVWDVLVTYYNCGGFLAGTSGNIASNELMAFCKYTLYDGPDALIANKLLEMGISINPGNVDWYKRSLLSAQ